MKEGEYQQLVLDLDHQPGMQSVRDILHLGDSSAADLLDQLRALEGSNAWMGDIRRDMERRREGRSMALVGVHHSFLGRVSEADQAFRLSEQYMEYEACGEIRLHRVLWHAEHKTRVGDWAGARNLLDHAHRAFMEDDSPSEFILHHFPSRFQSLCKAILAQIPIDKVTANEPAGADGPERGASLANMPNEHTPLTSRPLLEHSLLEQQPLFAQTFRDSPTVDMEVWRRFVNFPRPPVPAMVTVPVTPREFDATSSGSILAEGNVPGAGMPDANNGITELWEPAH